MADFALFVTRADVVKFTSANGNIDTDSFIQYLKEAQDIHIQNYLGSKLYEKLQTDVKATPSSLAGNYLTLVNTHIKPCLVHWAMVRALPFLTYTVSNKGVFKGTSENAESITKEELDYLVEKERETAQYYTDRLIDFLVFNSPAMFPEYYTNNNDDRHPLKGGTDFEGWVL